MAGFVWSRENVAALDEGAAFSLVKSTGRAMRNHEDKGADIVQRAAFLTHAAYATGILADRGGHKGKHYMTTAAYAQTFGLSSHANVRTWRVLGMALVGVGVDPESDTYRRLQRGNVAQVSEVSEHIMSGTATVESVDAIVADWTDPATGRRKSKGTGAKPEGKGKGKAEGEDIPDVEPIVRVLAALKILDDDVKGLSAEEWADVESRVQKIITREVTVRAKAAATARKATARKATARKATAAAPAA